MKIQNNQKIFTVVLILAILLPGALTQAEISAPGGPLQQSAHWDGPELIDDSLARFPNLNHDGTRAVYLDTSVYGDKLNRPVMVSEFENGSWSAPVVIASNGVFDDSYGFQVAPQRTHPIISADGNVVAYLGYAGVDPGTGGDTYDIYIIDRDGVDWKAPVRLNSGVNYPHYRIDLSADGSTVVFSNYPFLAQWRVYVSQRNSGVWGAPVEISDPLYSIWEPSISGDGTGIACTMNNWLAFIERVGNVWLPPVKLTDNDAYLQEVELPRISADGNSIVYWLIDYVEEPPYLVAVSMDMYVVRREAWGWSDPEKMTATPLVPRDFGEQPAIDAGAARAVYNRSVINGDTFTGSFLESIEWTGQGWSAPTVLIPYQYDYFNEHETLSGDGQTLLFRQYSIYSQGLFSMKTQTPPVSPVRVTGIITPGGGELFSPDDNTSYFFPAGAFTDTVMLLHQGRTPQYLPSTWPLVANAHAFDLTAVFSGAQQPAQIEPGYIFTVTIDPLNSGSLISDTLALWWWDEQGAAWSQSGIDSFVKEGGRQLVAQVSHLSLFAVLGETQRVYLPLVIR